MNIDEVFPSKWLEPADLQGRDVDVQIEGVQMEKVGMETQPVAYFEGKRKGLVLNKTRARQIKAATGTPDTDRWKGLWITLYTAPSATTGKDYLNVREQMPSRQPTQRVAPPPPPYQPSASPATDTGPVYDDQIPF